MEIGLTELNSCKTELILSLLLMTKVGLYGIAKEYAKSSLKKDMKDKSIPLVYIQTKV